MFKTLLVKITRSLTLKKIPHMIIGGQAVLIHGEPRLTRDIDVTLGLDVDDMKKLLDSAKEMNLKPLPENIESFVTETMVLPCLEEESGIRVDFILSFSPYERQAIERAVMVKIEDNDVPFASVEDLVIHKLFAGRPRDIEDVRGILLKNKDIDIAYVGYWLNQFDRAQDGRSLADIFAEVRGSPSEL